MRLEVQVTVSLSMADYLRPPDLATVLATQLSFSNTIVA